MKEFAKDVWAVMTVKPKESAALVVLGFLIAAAVGLLRGLFA